MFVNSFACPNCREIYFRKSGIEVGRPVRCSKCKHSFPVGEGEVLRAVTESVPELIPVVVPAEPPPPKRRRRWRRVRLTGNEGSSVSVWVGLGLACVAFTVLVFCIVHIANLLSDAAGPKESQARVEYPPKPPSPDPPPPKPEPRRPGPDGGPSVYEQAIRGCVLVYRVMEANKVMQGSGVMVDSAQGLLLTNFHVVGDKWDVEVLFPLFDAKGSVVQQREAYASDRYRSAARGRVLAKNLEIDLALVRVDRLPQYVTAVSLAAVSPSPGDRVHSIGNPGASRGLWNYTPGHVKTVLHTRWMTNDDVGQKREHHGWLIETESRIAHGDSGGPLLNDRAELIGISQSGNLQAEFSIFVDIREIRAFLRSAQPPR